MAITYGTYQPGPRSDWRAAYTEYRYHARRGFYVPDPPAGYANPCVDQLAARAEGKAHWGDQWTAPGVSSGYKVATYMNPIGKRHEALCVEFGWPVPSYNVP